MHFPREIIFHRVIWEGNYRWILNKYKSYILNWLVLNEAKKLCLGSNSGSILGLPWAILRRLVAQTTPLGGVFEGLETLVKSCKIHPGLWRAPKGAHRGYNSTPKAPKGYPEVLKMDCQGAKKGASAEQKCHKVRQKGANWVFPSCISLSFGPIA